MWCDVVMNCAPYWYVPASTLICGISVQLKEVKFVLLFI